MIDAKSISEEQKLQIQTWADEGLGLPDIQRRLDDKLGIKVTYMETRFLVDDLGIKMPEEEKPEPAEEEAEAENTGEEAVPELPEDDDKGPEPEEVESPESNSCSVKISELQRPGAMVSGSVTFAGGETADWWMDQMGRLGMDSRNPEYRPSESDMMDFQRELQAVAKKQGY